MNDYSFIQKSLHRMCLSNIFIRKVFFELEKLLFLEKLNTATNEHVFVAGLARAGTTVLLKAIHTSEQFASLSYADMPFILAPNIWKMLNPTTNHREEKERAHGDSIFVTTDSVEAFEETFWQTFDGEEVKSVLDEYVQLILKRYNKNRYLSKNNQNIKRIHEIIELFPSSFILIPFREPLQHANSLLSQHIKFSAMQTDDSFIKEYMDWIGHSEFGLSYQPIINDKLHYPLPETLNHWLEQWHLVYSKLLREFSNHSNVIFVCYEQLCTNKQYWVNMQNKIKISNSLEYNFRQSHKDINHEFNEKINSESKRVYHELIKT